MQKVSFSTVLRRSFIGVFKIWEDSALFTAIRILPALKVTGSYSTFNQTSVELKLSKDVKLFKHVGSYAGGFWPHL